MGVTYKESYINPDITFDENQMVIVMNGGLFDENQYTLTINHNDNSVSLVGAEGQTISGEIYDVVSRDGEIEKIELKGVYDGGIIDRSDPISVKFGARNAGRFLSGGDVNFVFEEGTEREAVFSFNKDGSFIIDDYNSRWVNSGKLDVSADGSYFKYTNGFGSNSTTERGTNFRQNDNVSIREGTRQAREGFNTKNLPIVSIFETSVVAGSSIYHAKVNFDGSEDRAVVVQTENGLAKLDIHCPSPDEKAFSNWWSQSADLTAMDGIDLPDPAMDEALKMETTALAALNEKLEGSGARDIPVEGDRPTSCALPKPTSDRFGF